MPVIPINNEGQRLNPSSPVPAVSPERADMMGEANAQLGNAMVKLGLVLDKNDKEDARISAQIAASKLKQDAIKLAEQQKGRLPDPNDSNGTKAVEGYVSNVREASSKYTEGLSDQAKKYYEAHVEDIKTDFMPAVYSAEGKKKIEITKQKYQELAGEQNNILSTIAAAKDYNGAVMQKELLTSFAVVEKNIRQDQGLTEFDKESMVKDYKKSMAINAMNAIVNESYVQGKDNFFDAEKLMLSPEVSGLLDDKEMEKIRDNISVTRGRFYTDEQNKIKVQGARAEQEVKIRENAVVAGYVARIRSAGTDEIKRQIVFNDIEADILSGRVTDTNRLKNIMQTADVFNEPMNDRYDASLMGDILQGKKTVDQAVKQVRDDIGRDGKLTPKRGSDILNRLQMIRDAQNRDPNIMQAMQAGEDMIRSLAKDDFMSFMNEAQKRDWLVKIESAVGRYRSTVKPGVNPVTWAASIMKKDLKYDVKTAPTVGPGGILSNGLGESNADQIRAKKETILRNAIEMNKQKKLKPDEKKKIDQEIKRLNMKQEALDKESTVDMMTRDFNSRNSKATGVRGK